MNKRFLLLSFLIGVATIQLNSQSIFGDKVYVGGGVGSEGIVFNAFNIYVSANGQAGYKISDQLSAGLNLRYIYDKYRFQDVLLNHFGGGPYVRYIITRSLFVSAEYERMTYERPYTNDLTNTYRQGFNSAFVGGGYFQPLNRNASLVMVGYYNLLYGDGTNSQYNSPFLIRAGFNVGF